MKIPSVLFPSKLSNVFQNIYEKDRNISVEKNSSRSSKYCEPLLMQKMDQVKFECETKSKPIATRQEYLRKKLSDQFTEYLKDGLTPLPVNNEKNLQGIKIVSNCNMDDNKSKDVSCWSEYANPIRGFRRTNKFTKPDSEYYGPSPWRWV